MSNYIHFNKAHLNKIADLGQNQLALKVFMFMCNNMNSSNTIVISMKALIGIFNVSRQSISKAIKYLKDNDLLYVYKNGTSNIYVINQNVVCF